MKIHRSLATPCSGRPHPRRPSATHRPLALQTGFSLIELLVSITIGLFLMIAVGAVSLSTNQASLTSMEEAQLNEDGALALQLMAQQLRMAGYSNPTTNGNPNFQGVAIRGCDGPFANSSAAFDALACSGTGSDAIAVRFDADKLNTVPAEGNKTWQWLLSQYPSNCTFGAITGVTSVDVNSASAYAVADNRYVIRTDGQGTPNLYCRGRESDSKFSSEEALIPNIEQLQIRYAVTKTPVAGKALPHQVTAYVSASDAALGATAANWRRVSGVSLCLVARSANRVSAVNSSTADVGSYVNCNGERASNDDGYMRRSFRTTVQLRNLRPGIPAAVGGTDGPWSALNTN